jgi:uncharacterized protein (TIGR02996 family)
MTDDEAFIRAVVDRPGDDTPRLVYADWLDDHDDPARAAYLRAEREAVVTGDAAGLRELAAGLDPVWVARVGRPPAGVCCEHVRLRRGSDRNIDPDELAFAAEELGRPLPPQLRALLLNYNPGRLSVGPFYLPMLGRDYKTYIDELPDLDGQDEEDDQIGPDLIERTWWLRQEWECPDHLLFLAGTFNEGHFCVSAAEADHGRVYAVLDITGLTEADDRDAAVAPFADSVGEFLARLEPRTYPLADDEYP